MSAVLAHDEQDRTRVEEAQTTVRRDRSLRSTASNHLIAASQKYSACLCPTYHAREICKYCIDCFSLNDCQLRPLFQPVRDLSYEEGQGRSGQSLSGRDGSEADDATPRASRVATSQPSKEAGQARSDVGLTYIATQCCTNTNIEATATQANGLR